MVKKIWPSKKKNKMLEKVKNIYRKKVPIFWLIFVEIGQTTVANILFGIVRVIRTFIA